MKTLEFVSVNDYNSYSEIIEFIFLIDEEFNLTSKIPLSTIWDNTQDYSIDAIAKFMYLAFCGKRDEYMHYVNSNMSMLLTKIKQLTHSHRLFTNPDKNEIHVEYILRFNRITKQNEESVSRLTTICRMLPFFDLYCADAIKPSVSLFSQFSLLDNAHKTMPRRNLIIGFHQKMTSLWYKTISSNYEFDSFEEWVIHWFQIRKVMVELLDWINRLIVSSLKEENHSLLTKSAFNELVEKYEQFRTGEHLFPGENRPFLDVPTIAEEFKKIKTKYFEKMYGFFDMVPQMLNREQRASQIAIINIKEASFSLSEMQKFFSSLELTLDLKTQNENLCTNEKSIIPRILNACLYFTSHKPNRAFEKHQINKWIIEKEKSELDQTKEFLSGIQHITSVQFPDTVLKGEILVNYPIIIKNWDKLGTEEISHIIIACIPFKDSPFDYLLILIENERSIVSPNALRIHKSCFKELNRKIESDELDSFDFFHFLPFEVTQELLTCFSEDYSVEKQEIISPSESVLILLDTLWAYSHTRSILQEPADSEYLDKQLIELRIEIGNELQKIETTGSPLLFETVKKETEAVINGKSFEDSELNSLLENSLPQEKTHNCKD